MTTGGAEILVVLALAVLLFGPKKLPEIARTIGQAMGEYHKATREFENEIKKTSTAIDREVSSATSVEPKSKVPRASVGPGASAPKALSPASTGANIPPRTSPKAQDKKDSYKVKEIASNLGIETENKTDAQLLREISLKTKKKKVDEG